MIATTFYNHLIGEVIHNARGLPDAAYHTLRRYYHTLDDHPHQRAFYRYNWIRRTEPLAQLLTGLPSRTTPYRLLDAGCGAGTESIFCATLRDDVEITGVDISKERLKVAKARKTRYERHLGKTLRISFLQQDVFRVLRNERFDVIWAMEAISHIHPTEDLLTAVSENLGCYGFIVISDSHILNPAMAWRIFKMRRRGIKAHTYRNASIDESIPYAQERLFAVGQLSRKLKQAGFSSIQTQLSVFFPPSLARIPWLFPIGRQIDVILNKVPLLRNIGGIYTVVASK